MIAQALELRLGRPRVSTDERIEAIAGRSIKDIFAQDGEGYFRQIENAVIKEVSRQKGMIIDCGGGVVLNPLNLPLLKEHGIVFFIDAAPEVIYQRIKGDPNRPLVNVPDPQERIAQLYKQRLPLYSQADHTVDASEASIEGPVAQICSKV